MALPMIAGVLPKTQAESLGPAIHIRSKNIDIIAVFA
jgi:hypothetical protein